MSCKDKWAEYNDQLNAVTNLPPGSADGAPRCIQCQRPLLKNGQCVMGHAQAAGQRPAVAPLMDALRCLLTEMVQKTSQELQNPAGFAPIAEAQQLLANGTCPTDLAGVQQLLQSGKQLQLCFGPAHEADFYADPRVQAATSLLVEQRLREAAPLAASSNPAQQLQALQLIWAAEVLAGASYNPTSGARARLVREQLLPVTEVGDTANIVAQQINALAGAFICRGCRLSDNRELEQLMRGEGVRILVPHGGLELGRYEALDVLRQELGVSLPLAVDPQSPDQLATVSTSRVMQFLQRRIRQQAAAVDALTTPQQALTEATGQLSPVALVQQHALPLYQAASQLQEAVETELRGMGAPGLAILERLFQVKAQSLEALEAVPLRNWPQALAGLHFAPRVMALLKFRAVREAVCNPHNSVDLLSNLPRLGPRAVAGLRACELLEKILALGTGAQDRRTTGPQTSEEVDALLQVGAALGRVGEWELAAQSGPPQRERWWQAVATLVDALSAHATTPPLRVGAAGTYAEGSRLSQARAAYQDMWTRSKGLFSAAVPHKTVRQWGEQAGMPLARYANPYEIFTWLQDPMPDRRAKIECTVRAVLWNNQQVMGPTEAALQATDRTGADHNYKPGEWVRLRVAGVEQEGKIRHCLFLASAETEPGLHHGGPPIPVALHPAVAVKLTDGREVQVPIAEVEVMAEPPEKKPAAPGRPRRVPA